ncbi:MAG: carboxypeptidase-like regulatory domain-containing protein [Sporichthyaceae bacterium]
MTWAVYLRARRTADAQAPTVESIAAARPAPSPSRPGLHGAVVTAAGPLVGAPVTLLDDRGGQVARTRANSAGSFHLTGMASGRYLLVCSGLGLYRPTSTVVDLDAHRGLTLEPFVLVETPVDPSAADAEVVGTASDAIGPVGDALVTLLDGNGAVCAATHTDRAGRFRVGPAPTGPCTLTVVAAGFEPTSAALISSPGIVRHDPAMRLCSAPGGAAVARTVEVPTLVD